jgi:hypothetical protein
MREKKQSLPAARAAGVMGEAGAGWLVKAADLRSRQGHADLWH